MDVNEVIVLVMMVFMVLGAIDRAIGNKFGLGQPFEEGFNALGPLALAMVGVVSLAPVLAKVLRPVVVPVYEFLGADPSMFATTLLANDMGGYPLALELGQNPDAALLAGLILGAMMGPTIVFTIPVALGIIPEKDRGYLAKGILAGMITIPIGVFAGGLVAGFDFALVVANLVPIVIAAGLIAFGLWKAPDAMTRGFEKFGKGLVAVISVGLAIAVFEYMVMGPIFDATLYPAGWELAPVTDGLEIIALIGMMLLGAFPLVFALTRVFSKPLTKAGKSLGMNDAGAGGMIATLANNIPMFGMFKDMNARSKVLNSAFAVSAAFTFGDHLGFTAGANRSMIFPMIVGKLIAGVTAVVVAMWFFGKWTADIDEAAAADEAAEAGALAEDATTLAVHTITVPDTPESLHTTPAPSRDADPPVAPFT